MPPLDARDGVGEVGLGVDAIQFAGLDQRGDGRPVFGAAVGAGEEGVLAGERDGTDRAFDGVLESISILPSSMKRVRPYQRARA
jgi:hypothetical protein